MQNASLLDELENLNARWVREDDECFLDLKNTKDALVHILAEVGKALVSEEYSKWLS